MSRRAYQRRRRPNEGSGCLGAIAWMGVLILVLVAAYGIVVRPLISGYIGDQAAEQLGRPTNVDGVIDQAAGALPDVIAALPAGEIVVLEQEANAYLNANPQALAPLDSANLNFTPGTVLVTLSAYGLNGTASATLAAEAGQLVVRDPEIDGPIGLVVSGPQIIEPLIARLNTELALQGKTIQDVRVEEDRMVIVTG
ncbi:MAG: hypothetical protein HC822_01205 [Oscillochloris sp.]|nr:hypothetical protein [Oscillochloris sp.]